ncbi:MAG TPA: NAD-dependent epimerase/dehydratase family protein [Victivallales bacterium]|nr:NAD-dependent epimerase/dehydratase family protein [Victivallales bacterium]HRR29244.1 NAD-dependent epimerase/dehydratase family protein [Victivallales bacterium]
MIKKKQRFLITGGAGFVGSNIAIAIKENLENTEVFALDNLYRKGSELNLPRLSSYGIKFIKGDVRNPQDLEIAGKADFLIECSAEPSVLAGKDGNTDFLIGTNLIGAINCAEYCKKYDTGIVFLSTSRVYPINAILSCELRKTEKRFDFSEHQLLNGVSPEGISEEFPMTGARSLYGATKFAAETMLVDYAEAFNIKVIINRLGVIAGPWQFGKSDQGIVPFWIAAHIFEKKINYIGFGGRGQQVRDFLHIDDLVRLILMQLSSPDKFSSNGKSSGSLFNIGGGKKNSLSLLELTELCQQISGRKVEIGSIPETRYADVPVYITDYKKLNNLCSWKPEKSVYNIIQDIFDWIISTPEASEVFK